MADAQVVPTYETSFEAAEGYTTGSLDGQLEWSVDAGAASVVADAESGAHSVVLQASAPRTRISRDFTEFTGEDIVFIDFSVRGGAGEPPSNAPEASSPDAFHVAIAAEGDVGRFYVLDGDGLGFGDWVPTAATVPLDENGELTSWAIVMLRLDYVRKTFDVYLNGAIAGFDYGFSLSDQESFSRFVLSGNPGMEILLDDFYVSPVSLAWANQAGDGIADSWKSLHDLPLDADIRDGDPYGDGLSNIARFFLQTGFDPASLDSEGELIFHEDFGSGTLHNWTEWSAGSTLGIATDPNRTPGGEYSAHLSASDQKMYRMLGTGVPGATRITFWMYDDMGDNDAAEEQTRWFGEARSGFQQIFAIGRYSSGFGTGTGTLSEETVNAAKYQGRVYSGTNSGWFNLNAPDRSPGWHRFEIERLPDGTTLNFFVDGVLGRTITDATDATLDRLTIGTGFGSTVGSAWFDDISIEYFAPPSITKQPNYLTVETGATAVFTVEDSSASEVEYQWKRDDVSLVNGVRIQGANGPQLTIFDITHDDAGRYTVEVSNAGGAVVSSPALLSVDAHIVFYDDFETATLDNWTIVSGASGLAISPGNNFSIEGLYVAEADSSSDRMYHNLAGEVDSRARVTFWVYDDLGAQNRVLGEIRAHGGAGFSGDPQQIFSIGWHDADFGTAGLNGEIVDSRKYHGRVFLGNNAGWFNLNAPGAPDRSQGWRKFEIERLADETTINFYVDGVLARTITGATKAAWDSVVIGSVGAGSTGGSGWFDDVKVEYFDPPKILAESNSAIRYAGSKASFHVTATGNVEHYQWRFNGEDIPGATSSGIELTDLDVSQAGEYRVAVTNAAGTVLSVPRYLAVVSVEPQHQTVDQGATVVFSVDAGGLPELNYQWRKAGIGLVDGEHVWGSNTSQLMLQNVTRDDEGAYTAVVSLDGVQFETKPGLLGVNGSVVFSDDFEFGSLSNWTKVPGSDPLSISSSQENPLKGKHAAHLSTSREKMYHNLEADISGPARAVFWIYDDGGEQTRWFGEVRAYETDGFSPNDKLEQVFAIGKYM